MPSSISLPYLMIQNIDPSVTPALWLASTDFIAFVIIDTFKNYIIFQQIKSLTVLIETPVRTQRGKSKTNLLQSFVLF